MLLAPTTTTPYPQDSRYSTFFSRPAQRQQAQPQQQQFRPRVLDLDLDLDIALDLDNSQLSDQSRFALDDSYMLDAANTSMTPSDAWSLAAAHGQFNTPRAASRGRVGHNRDSSLSSLGSAGPASPYSHTTSNPHIAVTDSVGGDYHGMPYYDDSQYQLAGVAKMHPTAGSDGNFFGSGQGYTTDAMAALVAAHKQKAGGADRGLLSLPDLTTGTNRSRPVSVASSIVSDSPATPSSEHQPQPNADEMRRKHGSYTESAEPHDLLSADFPLFDDAAPTVPKLDRTMTDVYGDELYSPNFAISAPPSQQTLTPVSPSNNDMFVQRLQAVNTHNLSATHSPVSSTSRGKSPFRHGSPLAPTPIHDFASLSSPQMRFNSAQQLREHLKAEQDAHALKQQIARTSDTGTPQTISPKDAMLEYNENEGDANFPLFGPQPTAFEMNQLNKAGLAHNAGHSFDTMALDTPNFNFNNMTTQLPTSLHIPQQYPFVARQQRNDTPSTNDGSLAAPISMTRATSSSASSSVEPGQPIARPNGMNADGGTYTCTYHGCTQRFETPALLQKHKREGHRSTHGPGAPGVGVSRGVTPSLTSPSSLLFNSQAGPHRCDRINPSTGKPCHTIFSRPYDLTRHEDTIHNARKQKVRCNLCTEDKTFSRADALTRHYRVCHPDVDFPGKHRRRGGSSG